MLHDALPLVPILGQMYPVHIITLVSTISTHTYLCLLDGLFPSGFQSKMLHAVLISPMCAIYPTHFILLDFISLIIFGEE
jgi:hypothetical protein